MGQTLAGLRDSPGARPGTPALVELSTVPSKWGGVGVDDVHGNLPLPRDELEYHPHFTGKMSMYLQLPPNPTSQLHQASDLKVGCQSKQLELLELKAGTYAV